MALITNLSTRTTVIDTIETTDAEIQATIRGFKDAQDMTDVWGASIIPISNTQAKIIVMFRVAN